MTRSLRTVLSCLVLLAWMTACLPPPDNSYPSQTRASIRVVSLQEYWPVLEQEARAWHPDAYLYRATFLVQVDTASWPLMQANMRSPSNPNEELSLTMDTHGQLSSQAFETSVQLSQVDPIFPDDIFDSQEALDTMLTPERIDFLVDNSDNACSHISLWRDGGLANSPPVWALSLWNCAGNPNPFPVNGTIIMIDALTGIELGDG